MDSHGQGRIRTSVARKERQIYSLLPLTTRPPVRAFAGVGRTGRRTLVSDFSVSLKKYRPVAYAHELAKGLEPPTC